MSPMSGHATAWVRARLTLRERYANEVGTAERQADRVTAEVNRLLHKTFITPIDREQIHGLINAMDDILDLLQDASETMSLYDVQAMNDDILRLGDLSAKCCERVQHAVSLLPKLNDHEVAAAAIKTCEEIDKLESDADRVMRSAMSNSLASCPLFPLALPLPFPLRAPTP